MSEKISLKWNLIIYDENTIYQSIDKILSSRFTNNDLEKTIDDLYDPYLLPDMQKRVDRIILAKENNEKVMIFWDYDVDGITSTSILMHFFKKIGMIASYRLPDRVKDWYWMKMYFIDEIASIWVKLIITVDCGTKDVEIIKYAKTLWVDVIVTDHHAVPDIIPEEAIAIINPKRKDSIYPFKDLAWAWVAFKLIQALWEKFLKHDDYLKYIEETIDIRAIWTVADCMPIIDENRIITKCWLEQIKKSRSLWIRKMIENKINEDLDADLFWFLIWPRLNATWRLDTPYLWVNIILNNSDKIDEILLQVEEINNRRKILTESFYNIALEKININDNVIFFDNYEIDHWIIWIIAWKLTEKYYKPSIVLKDEWEKLVASCRSPEYFSIVEYLDKYRNYFMHFWWHKQRAGFSIKKDKFELFKKDFLSEINSLNFSHHKKSIKIDKIVDISDIWFWFLNNIKKYKPFWFGNTKPVFMLKNFEILSVDYMWKTLDHITIKNKYWLKIIWFFMWNLFDEIRKTKNLDIIFDIWEEEWMGKRNITLKIIDLAI